MWWGGLIAETQRTQRNKELREQPGNRNGKGRKQGTENAANHGIAKARKQNAGNGVLDLRSVLSWLSVINRIELVRYSV